MIRCKLDVTKIDKSLIFVGQKGKYIDITLIETPNDKFGNDFMVVQDVGKEKREAGVKGAILGNAKIGGQKAATPAQAKPAAKPAPTTNPDLDESVPF